MLLPPVIRMVFLDRLGMSVVGLKFRMVFLEGFGMSVAGLIFMMARRSIDFQLKECIWKIEK